MDNKIKPCEEKNNFAPKMASDNAFKKRSYNLKKIQQKVLNKKDGK